MGIKELLNSRKRWREEYESSKLTRSSYEDRLKEAKERQREINLNRKLERLEKAEKEDYSKYEKSKFRQEHPFLSSLHERMNKPVQKSPVQKSKGSKRKGSSAKGYHGLSSMQSVIGFNPPSPSSYDMSAGLFNPPKKKRGNNIFNM